MVETGSSPLLGSRRAARGPDASPRRETRMRNDQAANSGAGGSATPVWLGS